MGKIIRDPVHNIIEIDDDALRIIDTNTFQRLRRIRQLGLAWQVYPSAEHSRFTHSIGVYHLSNRLFEVLKAQSGEHGNIKKDQLNELDEHKKVAELSALLHDVGHGAFSHTLEKVIKDMGGTFEHENMTKTIILDDPGINKVLKSIDNELPEQICNVIDKEYESEIVTMIVSSQLDADRMDYLLRDSHMTGAKYGSYDLEWILRNIQIRTTDDDVDNPGMMVIAVDLSKCLNAIEQYLLGRFYMYKHVYNHKVVNGFENLITGIFKHVLTEQPNFDGIKALVQLSQDSLPLENFIEIDDFCVIEWFKTWYNETSDPVLTNLLQRFFNRQPLKVIEVEADNFEDTYQTLANYCSDLGLDKEYFLYSDKDAGTRLIKESDDIKNLTQNIYVFDKDGSVNKIGNVKSSLLGQIRYPFEENFFRFYVVEEVYEKFIEEDKYKNGNT